MSPNPSGNSGALLRSFAESWKGEVLGSADMESDWLEDGLNRGLDAVGSPAFPLWQETKVFSLVTLKPSAVDPVLGTLI